VKAEQRLERAKPHNDVEKVEELRDAMFTMRKYGTLSELMARGKLLLKKEDEKSLDFDDVLEHQQYITRLGEEMESQKQNLYKQFKITDALLRRTTDSHRTATLTAKLEGIKRATNKFNSQVTTFNQQQDWFQNSPAFKKR